MSYWNDLVQWLYADVRGGDSFWYAQPLREIRGLDEDQLFWTPNETSLCMLWHVGHIAHREKLHIAKLIQGQEGEVFPYGYEVFGDEWCSVPDLRAVLDSTEAVLEWVAEVRQASSRYIASLGDDDCFRAASLVEGLSIGHWLLITVAHGALHIGKIQMLRNMLEGKRDNPC